MSDEWELAARTAVTANTVLTAMARRGFFMGLARQLL
jgi:hypothetical protein